MLTGLALTNVLLITLNILVFTVLLVEIKWMVDDYISKHPGGR